MIDYSATIARAAILNMTSARPDRIYLPYASTADIIYLAGLMILEHIYRPDRYPDTSEGDNWLSDDHMRILDRSTITAYFAPHPSRINPLAGLLIDVDTPDGQRLYRSIYVPSGNETAAEIISEFLAMGAPGLSADIRQSYERQHRAFMKRAILSGGAGLKPEQIIAAITD